MKIPMKVDYGVRALVELAMHYGEGQVHTSFAPSRKYHESYLVQLMDDL